MKLNFILNYLIKKTKLKMNKIIIPGQEATKEMKLNGMKNICVSSFSLILRNLICKHYNNISRLELVEDCYSDEQASIMMFDNDCKEIKNIMIKNNINVIDTGNLPECLKGQDLNFLELFLLNEQILILNSINL